MNGLALFASYTGEDWGSDRLLGDFATGLEPPVAVACPPGALADRLRGEGVEHIAVAPRSMDMRRSPRDRLATPLRLRALGRELGRAVRSRDPAVVIAWNSRGLLAASKPARRTNLVFHQNELLRGRWARAAVNRSARRAAVVIALSETIARDLDMSAQVAVGGVDLDTFPHAWPRLGPPTALFLGALVEWKRPDLALEAVALAAREIPELRLTMAGEPIGADTRPLEALRSRAQEPDLAGRVEFAGRVPDPREILASSHCLLHCASREPYGMAIVEALAAGLPVVASSAGGPTEIVDETCARLYAPGDAGGAAAALVAVLREPEPLGAAARAKAERAHSLERSQARYRELIDPLR